MEQSKNSLAVVSLALINFQNVFFWIWPIYFPYLASFINKKDHFTTCNMLYTGSIMFQIGIFTANTFILKLYQKIGLRISYQVASIMITGICILFSTFRSIIITYILLIFIGITHQIFCMTTSIFLKESYKKNLTRTSNLIYITIIFG